MRQAGVYPVIKMCHLHVEDEGVREGCERLVQVLMRDEMEDEGGEEGGKGVSGEMVRGEEDEDEDEKIVEIL